MKRPKSDNAIVSGLLKKNGRSYFYTRRALRRLGWGKGRIIKATDFLFKPV